MAALDEVLTEIIEDALLDVHTAFPAKVLRYRSDTQRADLQPLVKINGLALQPLLDIPVCWPRAGDAFMTLPLKPGHFVLVICAEESPEVARAGGGIGDSTLRRHSLGSAYCVPGCTPDSQSVTTHADNIVLGFSGGPVIHVKPGGTIALGSENPSAGVGQDTAIEARLSELQTAILAGLGGVPGGSAGVTAFNTSLATNPLWPSPTGSSVVKTE
jgi:hypothetical protein